MKNLFYLCCLLFIVSCNSAASDSGADVGSQTDTTVPNSFSKGMTWKSFWKSFQAAVANDDKVAVAKLTKFGNHISEESFNDYYDVYFGEEMKSIIAKTKFSDVPVIEDSVDFLEGRNIAYEELGEDEEGNEIGSALILYFGKDEGYFKLLMFFAAG